MGTLKVKTCKGCGEGFPSNKLDFPNKRVFEASFIKACKEECPHCNAEHKYDKSDYMYEE